MERAELSSAPTEGEGKGVAGTAANRPDYCEWASKRVKGGKRLETFFSEL